ncbi:LacI family DNA-binding transcriptional regulator [Actinoplanes sp. HUAS TT8]|uniref:LacI family DNA-binding transcriptional regulator n=1 Tax=Actinoplanes sp. HUAS TT8 TaxID=3447453 RepID=UPI003F525CE2
MVEERRATLKDVAAASGVSRATVSFVLNDTPNQTISEVTRTRVLRVVRELGYKPHGIARALREGSSRIVVLFIESGLEGNYSRSYIRGLDEELAAHDHVLVVRHGPTGPAAAEQVLGAINPRAVLRFGEAYRTGHGPEDSGGDGLAAYTGLQLGFLAERGHTVIALALPDDAPLGEVRRTFARRAADALGLPPLRDLTVPWDRAAATAAVEAFRRAEPAVTAIAAHDDDVALRVVTGLHDLGLRVPGDCAVIGFDDNEYGALFTPPLTTVHIDAEGHGRVAARTVLGLPGDDVAPASAQVLTRQTV